MAKHQAKLSKRAVDAAPIPANGELWIWDTELKGFFLRVRPSGRKVYAVRYRLGATQGTYTIGVHGSPWAPDEARAAARAALDRVRDGHDPTSKKREARQALSVADLIDTYVEDGPATKPSKRESTWANDRSNLNRHIRPLLGKKMADAVTQADAARAIKDVAEGRTAADVKTKARGRARITGGEGAARRTRMTAAAMYAWGIQQGLVKTNPFAGVKLPVPPVKERFLTELETTRLLEKIVELEESKRLSTTFADATRLLLFTGARKTEILGLRWSEVDWDRSSLRLPPLRTKAGGKTGERRIVLSPQAVALLERRRVAYIRAAKEAKDEGRASPLAVYVFPASHGDGHATGLRKAFQKAARTAKIESLRVHDLRHTFASFAIADGASLFLVGKLLGHASTRTTERYAHLAGDPLHNAVAEIGRRFGPP